MTWGLIAVLTSIASYSLYTNQQLKNEVQDYKTLVKTINDYAIKSTDRRQKKIQDLENLVKVVNKELTLFYTLQKTGIKAESIEEVRDILKLTKNIPIGSPFNDGHIITSPFGLRDESLWGGDGVHFGIDLTNKSGSRQVNLTADGTIVEFGYSETYGKYIVVDTDFGYRLKYAHLKTIFYQDDEGKVLGIHLKKGQRLGIMGETGLATGPHLHYEIQIWNDLTNEYLQLDPEEILNYIGN